MLIDDELARGELVVACDRPLAGERGYYLVTPERAEDRAALAQFRAWLLAQAQRSRACEPQKKSAPGALPGGTGSC